MIAYFCRHKGCVKYAIPDSKYCQEHQSDNYDWGNRQGHFNYQDSEWRKLSKELLEERPICENCGVERSTEVHHIIAIRDGGDPYNKNNLICLCHSCHTSITNQEISRRNKKTTDERKIKELMKRYNIKREEAINMIEG